MRNELQKVTKEWMALERKTLQQRKEADQFYDDNLMQLIEKSFIRRNKDKVTERVDYLIVSVGTSYEPIVLSIRLFRPKQILFLYTEITEKILNKIVDYCGLDASSYQKCRVHETNPVDIYREIKQAYLQWNRPRKLFIDFTGGTKSMSAAAAMAGAVIDVQMVYVGTNDYLVDFRKPYPGSETLFYIDNPLSIFGDLEIEKAMVLFDRANFSGAMEQQQSPLKTGKTVDEKVTIPTSRTMSREKEKQVVEELNIHKKVQELAAKIVELKKQKRGIDKNIRKIEAELEEIFDRAESDCMEIDMGLLVRRKKDGGYEWIIEI